ncbi:MAG: succinic semialdehyde dehydrogenase [Corynebacterium sp.]|nr:succinic semialdehyde dehydrogenase [Corynebacterium sp.]
MQALSLQELSIRARQVQDGWAQSTPYVRASFLRELHKVVLDHAEEIMDSIQMETGKTRRNAYDEVLDVAQTAGYYARRAPGILRAERRHGMVPALTKSKVYHRPYGVVGIICPWNFPFSLVLADAIAALAAGNAVILKPSPLCAATARLAVKLLKTAGIPEELVILANEDDWNMSTPELGQWMAKECDYILMTGSAKSAAIVSGYCAAAHTPFSAELGGKNPMIISATADLDLAVAGALSSCFDHAGQVCMSTERIYVESSAYDEFLQKFIGAAKGLRLGADKSWETDMGSLINTQHLKKVDDMVQAAKAEGATIALGGHPLPHLGPAFYAPTIITGAREDMAIAREEVFGPVVVVMPVADMPEAIRRSNHSPYGLAASIYGHPRFCRAAAKQLRVGTVTINAPYRLGWASLDTPMGGFGLSGHGRRHAKEGILRFCAETAVTAPRFLGASRVLFGGKGISTKEEAATMAKLVHLRAQFFG